MIAILIILIIPQVMLWEYFDRRYKAKKDTKVLEILFGLLADIGFAILHIKYMYKIHENNPQKLILSKFPFNEIGVGDLLCIVLGCIVVAKIINLIISKTILKNKYLYTNYIIPFNWIKDEIYYGFAAKFMTDKNGKHIPNMVSPAAPIRLLCLTTIILSILVTI